jgi:hypothetical protein
MSDYYPLISRAVAGLEKNSGEARRALYERARTALVAQLRALDPPLSESEITRERLLLEEAVRKVEAESARRPRAEASRRDPATASRSRREDQGGEAAKPAPAAPRRTLATPTIASDDKRAETAPHPAQYLESSVANEEKPAEPAVANQAGRNDALVSLEARRSEARALTEAKRNESSVSGEAATVRAFGRIRAFGERVGSSEAVVAEPEAIGERAGRLARSERTAFVSVPGSNVTDFDRGEPRPERPLMPMPSAPPSQRGPAHEHVPEYAPDPVSEPVDPSIRLAEPSPRQVEPRPSPRRALAAHHGSSTHATEPDPKRSMIGLILALLAVLVIVILGGTAYWQRDLIKSLFTTIRSPVVQAPREATPTRPKIPDRVGQPSQTPQTPAPGTEPGTAAAQRVVLYEEEPTDSQTKRYVGSAVWRTETVSPGPGLAPELAIRADVEVPERRMNMTISLRRNTDQALPASHTIEIMFNLPPDFPFGGISNVPGILMKQTEETRGAPLGGLAVKVTSGFFLVGLTAVEADMQRNVKLLKERAWFDIPVVYSNGRRAILAIEKGAPGERSFNDAFAAWGQ